MFSSLFCVLEGNVWQNLLLVSSEGQIWLHAPLKAVKTVTVLLLTMAFCVFQSIEREEPIEVDPTPTHAGLENGHAAATGNCVFTAAHFTAYIKMLIDLNQHVSRWFTVTEDSERFFKEVVHLL